MSGYGRGHGRDPAAAAYRESRLLSSSPEDLVVMAYERLLADLRGAAIAIRAHDIERKSLRIQRATDILFELMASLDHAQGGEISQRLAALYAYMISRIGEASRNLDAAALDEVAGYVDSLLQAWTSVAAEATAVAPPPPPPGR